MPFTDPADRRRYQRWFYNQPQQFLKRSDYTRTYKKRPGMREHYESVRRERRQRDRLRILERDGFACVYCGACHRDEPRRLQIDHKVPLHRGGSNLDSNKITACASCNQRKGIKTYSQFMAIMQPDRIPDWVTDDEEEDEMAKKKAAAAKRRSVPKRKPTVKRSKRRRKPKIERVAGPPATVRTVCNVCAERGLTACDKSAPHRFGVALRGHAAQMDQPTTIVGRGLTHHDYTSHPDH